MKGLIIFSDKMEDNEALSTLALLRRANFNVESATINHNLEVKTSYNITVFADHYLPNLSLENYDFLIIPGGPYVNLIIDTDIHIKNAISAFFNANKVIGAICAAPRFLGRLGLLADIPFTAFPGSEKDFKNSKFMGGQKAVTYGNIVTARSAGSVIEFVYNLITRLNNEAAAKELLAKIYY